MLFYRKRNFLHKKIFREINLLFLTFLCRFASFIVQNMSIHYIFGILILMIILIWLIITYNKFIAKNNRVKQTESTICVMLKQRNDLIPNLVATVQAYMGYENATLLRITELRSQIQQTNVEQEQIRYGSELTRKLTDVKISVENYPELKADKQFSRLQDSIEEMELQLQAARRTFNAAAVDFNNFVQMFPSSIIASAKHYQPYTLITIPDVETANVNIHSLLGK